MNYFDTLTLLQRDSSAKEPSRHRAPDPTQIMIWIKKKNPKADRKQRVKLFVKEANEDATLANTCFELIRKVGTLENECLAVLAAIIDSKLEPPSRRKHAASTAKQTKKRSKKNGSSRPRCFA